tara:strand:+ start:3415 stop:4482 length:1068 start_codon:yes stop_codon:yes gene_type:complete
MKLILESGDVFQGESYGAPVGPGEILGEVVFNTAMSGYQEVFTDPSYCDQIVTMTYPLIGNYGVSIDDYESIKPSCKGIIAKEFCEQPSHWKGKRSIKEFLIRHNIPAMSGVDTRKLVKIIRSQGALKGVFASDETRAEEVKEYFKSSLTGQIKKVSTKNPVHHSSGGERRVVVLDFGCKKSIVSSLLSRKCDVVLMPWDSTFADIQAQEPDGIVLSNGPGDPKELEETLPTIRELQSAYPLFGICMGHQVFALANGCKTHKLKFGHRGSNHPVKDIETSKVFITSQNHGYTVDAETVKATDLTVSQTSLNDNTVEGLEHKYFNAFSVQYHPEANPGPSDTNFLFDKFINMLSGE